MANQLNILVLANRNPFAMARLLSGMGKFALERDGWGFEVVDRDRPNRKRDLHRAAAGVNGVVTVGVRSESLERVVQLGLPTVSIHVAHPCLLCVDADDDRIGQLAGSYFLERGYTRVEYYGPAEPGSVLRLNGLAKVLQESGCRPPVCNFRGHAGTTDWDYLQDPQTIWLWLSELDRPSGVVAFNDQLGAAILAVCQQKGIGVPDDLAILGVDNTELRCRFLPTPLSSVDPNLLEIGYQAASCVDAMILGKDIQPGIRRVCPLGVVTRKSTDTLMTADAEVKRAASIIRDRACDGLDYEQLMEEFAISRRTLERRFRAELGRSLGEEIRRVRLARVRELLELTELPLADIAARTGFEYASYLSRAFKKAFGENPSDHRARSRHQR